MTDQEVKETLAKMGITKWTKWKVRLENGSTIETVDTQWVKDCARARDIKYREWTEEEVENFKNMLKIIKDNLYRFYKR